MRTTLAALALVLSIDAPHVAFGENGPNPDLGHCADDASISPENIVSSCITYINEAYMQNWGMQYVPRALYNEALARRRQGKIPEAEKLAIRAEQMAPAYFPPWRLLVVMATNVPESDADMKAVDAMIAAHPGSAEVLNSACWQRAKRGQQLEAAMADCNEAIRLNPADAETLDSRCFTRVKMGKFSDAITDCDAALKLDPTLATSLFVRGVAELKVGLHDAGSADIVAAKQLDPTIQDTYAGYGVTP